MNAELDAHGSYRDMHPGDIVEWYYKRSSEVVDLTERLWSSVMRKWVPIGGLHLLISYVDCTLTFMPLGHHVEELFLTHLKEDDIWWSVGVPQAKLFIAHEDDLPALSHRAIVDKVGVRSRKP
jgi:hypothetical protein